MKKILFVSIVAAMIFSACKKQPVEAVIYNSVPPAYLSVVQKYVRQHVSAIDYDNIDFDLYRVSKQKAQWYVRVPLKNKTVATDFVLLQTDSLGNTTDGKIIHLEKTVTVKTDNVKATSDPINYTGVIDIASLDRKAVIRSAITKGYIEAWHPKLFNASQNATSSYKAESFPVPYDELPEVVVVAYIPSATSDTGLSWSDYMMLESMFSGGGGGSGSAGGAGDPGNGGSFGYDEGYGVYTPVNYGTGTNSPATPPHIDPNVTLSFDESFSRPAIDLSAWMKCFTDIPDAGASCSFTLLGDLPVDGHPEVGLNIWNGNTGHCFLQLNKTNGSLSVTQVIGFTAQSAGKSIINPDAFVPGKIIDNAGHKYNCSITMYLSPYGLNTVIDKIKALSDMPYSIVNYDCLDFGLNVINAVRPTNPLMISKQYDPNDPFSNIATGPKLYTLLQSMLETGSPETPNILLGSSVYAGVSHGACN